MIHSQQSKSKVLLIALAVSTALLMGTPRRANAYSGEAGLAFLFVAAVATYATVMGTVCAPVAAAKSSDYEGGFSRAYKDCFNLELKSTEDKVADEKTPVTPVNQQPEIDPDTDWEIESL